MRRLNYDQFVEIYEGIRHSFEHMEFRDSYGTDDEIPAFAAWKRGEGDDGSWLDYWRRTVRKLASDGKSMRRIKVVSTPVTDYHRWIHSNVASLVEAGEDHRWCPRHLVSSVAFPGNDFYVLDDEAVMFLLFDGNGSPTGYTYTKDLATVELYRSAFDEVWKISIPHNAFAI